MRIPYVLEEKFGINMRYKIIKNTPNHLITLPVRHASKSGDIEEIKNFIFTGEYRVDDPIDMYSLHTLLHDAVIYDRPEIFEFLLKQGANPMVRD